MHKEFEEQCSALHFKECCATSIHDLAKNVDYYDWVSSKNESSHG